MSPLQAQCDLYITTNFDSECLLTEYIKGNPTLWDQGLEDCLQACKGNTVQYTAVCSSTVTQYSWTISGAASYYFTNQNRTAVVTWGNYNDVGLISVNVVTSDTNACTTEACVLLMESPQIASSTIPYYYYDQQGRKVIEVCLNEVVELMDMSTAGQTPIVGYQWITPFGNASTPDHSIIAKQTGEYIIKHLVQNECGCEGYEEFLLRVLEPAKLELSCYGTVCATSNESYTLLSPHCSQYMWSVEGGTFTTNPSNPATIDVQWGNPPSGYGVISIDAAFCDAPCKAMASIKIPVITNNTVIEGPDVVCVGDYQLYELPLWGSTDYWWNITPSVGDSDMVNTEEINQILMRFRQPGTYTLSARYGCDFIPCGPDSSRKTIIVKDTMSIRSTDHTLCIGATGSYTTWHGNSVTWRVYNQYNSQIYYTNGVTLNYTFNSAGRYKIVASNSNYCDDAEYLVTVLNNPPALTTTNGPHVACQESSILLSAMPTHPSYYLEWVPICNPSNVQNGNEVTISYGSAVCDVAVYQIDGENECRSTAYIHQVDAFQLAPHGLPAVTVACAGSTVSFAVPDQSENVTYEWNVSPTNAASVIGNHLLPSVDILTNHLSINPPYTITVTLTRTSCGGSPVNETVLIQIVGVTAPTLTYNDIVCQDALETFTATGGSSVSSDYTWEFSDTALLFHGASFNRTFHTTGPVTFTLTYQPNPNCDAVTVTGSLYVRALPVAYMFCSGTTLTVPNQMNMSYQWYHNGTLMPSCTTNTFTETDPNSFYGTYCCTVSYNDNPSCEVQGCFTAPGGTTPPCSNLVVYEGTHNCNDVPVTTLNIPGAQYTWFLSTNASGSYITPDATSPNTATATFNVPGTHQVFVNATDYAGQCYVGSKSVTIDCIPKFELSYDCNGNIVVTDNSLYRTGYTIPNRKYTIAGTLDYINLTNQALTGSIYVGIPTTSTTYTLNMTMVGSSCTYTASITIEPNPIIDSVVYSHNMCENTPAQFTAYPNISNYEYHWDFDDDSYNEGDGIYHTYDILSVNDYMVELTVTNASGCTSTAIANITVGIDYWKQSSLNLLDENMVCEGIARTIYLNPNANPALYTWYNSASVYLNPPSSSSCDVYSTGDYKVEVLTSPFGCHFERMLNVGFYTAPVARITGNTTYCLGEEVKLNGNTGSNNQYSWTITGAGNYSSNSHSISFTPIVAGTYYVNLDVTSPDGCVRSATCTVTVHQQPAAPPIAFYNNQCIHTPPVYVHSTASPSQNLLWSNGFYGASAQYYVPGYLTAYYIDPNTGCPSSKSTLFIPPAPNYDALLTGCYEKCRDELPSSLYVYNLYPYDTTSLFWRWFENNHQTAQGNSGQASLPIGSFGSYYMNTQYGNGCVAQSPNLEISEARICPCDSIWVEVDKWCSTRVCKLIYIMTVTIHNDGSQPAYFSQLTSNTSSNIMYVTPMPVTVAPGGSQIITVTLEFKDFANPYIQFTLYDPQKLCEFSFSEYFDWSRCVREGCLMSLLGEHFEPMLSTPHQVSFFKIDLGLPVGATNLVTMWSEPSQLNNYTYIPPTNVSALLMFSYGTLTQMAMSGQYICLHAIVCMENNYLCHVTYCIKAIELLQLVPPQFRELAEFSTDESDTTRNLQSGSFIPQADKPYLAPNPARDEVMVMGIAPEEVAEITVLTMQGGQVAEFRNDYRFNVSRLAKASYIVRVVTTDKQVYYLKLVKQ